MEPGRFRLALAVLALGVVLAGCDRRPRFVERDADSTAAVAPDTAKGDVQLVLELWDRAQDRASVAEASKASVELARAFMIARGARATPAALATYLDSIGVGAEVAGDPTDPEVVAVNFFSRLSPEAGSEPALLWREGRGVRAQPVEGRGLRLFQVAARKEPAREVALIFGRPASSGYEPMLIVLRGNARGDRFELAQTVGADSMGGSGRAEFGLQDGTHIVRARTYRPSPRFEECASCPHVYRKRVLAWGDEGFRVVSDEVEPSPYHSFVQFVNRLAEGDERAAGQWATRGDVVRDARRLGWDRPGPSWRMAPSGEESRDVMLFYRGPREAYRVSFELEREGWRVSRIEPAERVIE
jgi:hypothetical protein